MEENEIKNEEVNNIQISEDVISVMAGMAIQDIEGVAKGATGFAGGISEALGKKNIGKGVKVEIKDKEVTVDVGIIIKYGAKIPELAKQIQDKIKNDVETMTGFEVISVNVKIQGIENNRNEEKTEIVKEEEE